jgi:ribosome-binding ATPase YchF (GTP1/OBG family)
MKKWNDSDWCKWLNINPTDNGKFPKSFYNSASCKPFYKKQDEIRLTLSKSFEQYLESEINESIEHYNQSIIKLAARIEKKGLNLNTLNVKTSYIDVNIETILTDGVKTVKAFTIIASGTIQRPHYRYLIK